MNPNRIRFLPGVVAAGLLLVFGAAAEAIPTLTFDNTIAEGQISHTAGGPVVGTGITFDFIEAIDVPMNAGVTPCTDCVLEFTSGPLTSEGPAVWDWAGGGSFVITGEFATSGPGAVLLSGTFDETTATFSDPLGIPQIAVTGFGLDRKHPAILDFFGLEENTFVFADSTIAAENPFVGSDGSFSGDVTEADVTNTRQVPVPEPTSALLLILGLSCVVASRRRA